jgi:hypothetical protein
MATADRFAVFVEAAGAFPIHGAGGGTAVELLVGQQRLCLEDTLADADALEGMRVYDLRHSFLTAMILATGDAYAVSEYAQHSDIRTTMGYVSGASSARVKEGLAALAAVVPQSGAVISTANRNTPQRKPASLSKSKRPPSA